MRMWDEGEPVDFDKAEFCPGDTPRCGIVRVRGRTGSRGRVFLVLEEDPSGEYWEVVVCAFPTGEGRGVADAFDETVFVSARCETRGFQVTGATRTQRFELPSFPSATEPAAPDASYDR